MRDHKNRVLRILCADDDPDIRKITVLSLGLDADMIVESVPDGRSALKLLHSGFAPDVVLLDALMPDESGADVARAIRAEPEFDNVILVFLTALSRPQEHGPLFEAGAHAVIVKPFDPLTLAARVRQIAESV